MPVSVRPENTAWPLTPVVAPAFVSVANVAATLVVTPATGLFCASRTSTAGGALMGMPLTAVAGGGVTMEMDAGGPAPSTNPAWSSVNPEALKRST